MNIIGKRKYTFIASTVLVLASIVALSVWGLRIGIDFRGGTLMEVGFQESFAREDVEVALGEANLEGLSVQPSEENRFLVRFLASDEEVNDRARDAFSQLSDSAEILRTDFIGASVSSELSRKAIEGVIVASIVIALYIAWAFRRVSRPIPSWQYGIGALVALVHDVMIVLGVFALLGAFFGVEVGIPFVAAMLTVLGYSVNDTIVVYDRIRENILLYGSKESFEKIVNRSVNETLGRSINTSLTVVVVLLAIIVFGGATIQVFSFALLIGVIAGTYSSIFVASASLVESYHYQRRKDM